MPLIFVGKCIVRSRLGEYKGIQRCYAFPSKYLSYLLPELDVFSFSKTELVERVRYETIFAAF